MTIKFLCCVIVKKMANRIEALELWEGSFADPVNLIRHFEFFMKVDPEVLRCIIEVQKSHPLSVRFALGLT